MKRRLVAPVRFVLVGEGLPSPGLGAVSASYGGSWSAFARPLERESRP